MCYLKKTLLALSVFHALFYSFSAAADGTLTFDIVSAGGNRSEQIVSLANLWVRVDEESLEKPGFLLYDTGHKGLWVEVDENERNYSVHKVDVRKLVTKAPQLQATKETRKVAGARCLVVQEIVDGEALIEHCMANAAGLKLTARQVISLKRLFQATRKKGWDWFGIGSEDEKFVSIQSRHLKNNGSLELKKIDHQPIGRELMRTPDGFSKLSAE